MVNDVWPPGATTGPRVRLTNADKVLYPATGTTKADIFAPSALDESTVLLDQMSLSLPPAQPAAAAALQ